MKAGVGKGMEEKRSYGDNEKGRNAETDEGTERGKGTGWQERSLQNVRRRGGVAGYGEIGSEKGWLAGRDRRRMVLGR